MISKFVQSKIWMFLKKFKSFGLGLAIGAVPTLGLGIVLSNVLHSGAGAIIAAFLSLHSSCYAVAMTDTNSKIARILPKLFGIVRGMVGRNIILIIIMLCFWHLFAMTFLFTLAGSFLFAPIYLFVTDLKK